MFSPIEKKVLTILGGKKYTIKRLAEIYFNSLYIPMNPNAVISSAILRINKKCEYNKLDWFIDSSGGGRKGKTVWKQKR